MTSQLPFRVDGEDYLRRLARDVESLKRHTHQDPADSPEEGDTVPPQAPTDAVSSTVWGIDGAAVTLSWTAPTHDEALAELEDLSHYEVWWQYQSYTGWKTLETEDTTTTVEGLIGGEVLDWQVRASDTSGNTSDWLTSTVTTATGSLDLAEEWGNFEREGDTVALTYPSGNTDASTYSVGENPDQWTYIEDTTDPADVTFRSDLPYEGSRALRIYTATGEQSGVRSPLFPVTAGEDYLVTWKMMKGSTATSRLYVRMAAGADQTLDDYPAYSIGTSVTAWNPIENYDTPQGANGGSFTDGYFPYGQVFTVPSGMNWAAMRFLSYQPAADSWNWVDDMRVYKITGTGAYTGETGWIAPIPFAGSHVDFISGSANEWGPSGIRRGADGVVEVRVMCSGDGTTTDLFTLPDGFIPSPNNYIGTAVYATAGVTRATIYGVNATSPAPGIVRHHAPSATWSALTAMFSTGRDD